MGGEQREREAMIRALALAQAGTGSVGANPSVGAAVLDRTGAVAGEGRTEPHAPQRAGRHAEVVALQAAGDRTVGGTLVSTLEPCNGTGRTGPCAEAILAAGLARVVYALPDPVPGFAGGAEWLVARGVDVASGLLAGEATEVHRPWLTAMRRGWPYVTLKIAGSLDGRAAASDGTSKWITSPAARADAHQFRGQVGAIIVGSGTVLSDDPALTVRGTAEPRTPLRVVLDARGRTPPEARVLDAAASTYIHRDHDLRALGRLLFGEYGVRHVLVEGGPTVAGAFLAAGLVDEIVAYLAPAFLGAGMAVAVTDAFPSIAAAARFTLLDVIRVGADLRIRAVPRTEPDGQEQE